MKLILWMAIIGLTLSCAHEQTTSRQGRLLDDAELAQYRREAALDVNTVPREVVTLGEGPVDLSNWQSGEDRAESENAPSQSEAMSTTADASATSPDATPAAAAKAEAAESDAAADQGEQLPMTTEVLSDAGEDAGDWVEADDVALTPIE